MISASGWQNIGTGLKAGDYKERWRPEGRRYKNDPEPQKGDHDAGRAPARRLLRDYSKATAATAAEATAGGAATTISTTEAGASGAARRRREHGACLRGHGAEIVYEHVGIELRAVDAAVIPLGRLGHDALKRFTPVFLDAEGHGKGQK